MKKLLTIIAITVSFSAFAENSKVRCSEDLVSSYNQLTQSIIEFRNSNNTDPSLETSILMVYKMLRACEAFYGQFDGINCVTNREGVEVTLPSPSLKPLCEMARVSMEFTGDDSIQKRKVRFY